MEKRDDRYLIKLQVDSNIDKAIIFDGQAFEVGCPLYQENDSEGDIMHKKPDLDSLKFSQIVLENKGGDFRVFSSQFLSGEEEVLIMPNCAFMSNVKLDLRKDQVSEIKFRVQRLNDLRVIKGDNEIRINVYYKDSTGGGFIIRYNNWIRL